MTLEVLETPECRALWDSQDCQENLGFGVPRGRKEKRVTAALPVPACRRR